MTPDPAALAAEPGTEAGRRLLAALRDIEHMAFMAKDNALTLIEGTANAAADLIPAIEAEATVPEPGALTAAGIADQLDGLLNDAAGEAFLPPGWQRIVALLPNVVAVLRALPARAAALPAPAAGVPIGDEPDPLTVNGHLFVHVAACPCPRIQAEVERLRVPAPGGGE